MLAESGESKNSKTHTHPTRVRAELKLSKNGKLVRAMTPLLVGTQDKNEEGSQWIGGHFLCVWK